MQTKTSPLDFLGRELASLRQQHLYRQLTTIEGEQGPWVSVGGRRLLNLSSNNYLGLASHPELKAAAAKAALDEGVGTGASRLISGTMRLHGLLEERLARFKGQEAALVFNSGYAANLGLISTLVGRDDAVFSDELNHASIIDGCRLSRADVRIFPHKDMNALEGLLAAAGRYRRKLIVIDTVFSMDGDIAPLPEVAELAERHGCILMVDEAHATGVLGPGGRGAVAHFGLEGRVPIQMGTLSKSFGSFGAYVCGSRALVDYLVNTSRPFIFTTALPPAVLAASLAALDVIERYESLVQRLRHNAERLRLGLAGLGFDIMGSQTQIVPVLVGDNARALEMMGLLKEQGVLAVAIRPPTVPPGTARIRSNVMATHSDADLDLALQAFERAGRSVGLI